MGARILTPCDRNADRLRELVFDAVRLQILGAGGVPSGACPTPSLPRLVALLLTFPGQEMRVR